MFAAVFAVAGDGAREDYLGERWEEASVLLPAGGVSFHNCLSFHGSQENVSSEERFSLAVHLRDERAKAVLGDKNYYVSHLDDMRYSPIIFQT